MLRYSGGDARKLLNILELVVESESSNEVAITDELVVQRLQQNPLAYDKDGFHEGHVVKAEKVVNTIGAGDSFIAGFLYGVLNKYSVEECLQKGAEVASQVVAVFEPWVQ